MKTLYFHYLCDDDAGEVEGMFNDKGELLDTWCCNDACWRTEYFAGFMKELGFKVKDAPRRLEAKMEKAMRDVWVQHY